MRRLKRLDASLGSVTTTGAANLVEPDAEQPTAAILVGGYGGLGVHTLPMPCDSHRGILKIAFFYRSALLIRAISKADTAVEDLQRHTEASLANYVDLAQRLGMPSSSFMAIGTDAVDKLEHLAWRLPSGFPRSSSSPANSCSTATPGGSGCFTTRPPIRCSTGWMDACPWLSCRRG